MKKMESEEIACLLAIIIGGAISVLHPDKINDAFWSTVLSIGLIKFFWK